MLRENNHQYGVKRELNSSWKGGRSTKNGYIIISVPEHPFCDIDGNVREHRLVAEKYLLNSENSTIIDGKPYLLPEYVVHHIDENRANNEVYNLMVVTKSEHQKIHFSSNSGKRHSETGRFIKS